MCTGSAPCSGSQLQGMVTTAAGFCSETSNSYSSSPEWPLPVVLFLPSSRQFTLSILTRHCPSCTHAQTARA